MESGKSCSTRIRTTPSACAPQAERILVAGWLLPDAEQAGERDELVRERDARADARLGQRVAGEARTVVRLDRAGDRLGLAVVTRVVRAHDALQLGELADHPGEEVGLAEAGGAPRRRLVLAEFRRHDRREPLDPVDALELAAELVVEHHVREPGDACGERHAPVLVVEELRVGEPRPQHPLVAVHDVMRVRDRHVRDDQKPVREPSLAVHEREVLLVLLHREHQAFLRHFQERLLEMRLVHRRELDQRGYLVVERLLRGDRRCRPRRPRAPRASCARGARSSRSPCRRARAVPRSRRRARSRSRPCPGTCARASCGRSIGRARSPARCGRRAAAPGRAPDARIPRRGRPSASSSGSAASSARPRPAPRASRRAARRSRPSGTRTLPACRRGCARAARPPRPASSRNRAAPATASRRRRAPPSATVPSRAPRGPAPAPRRREQARRVVAASRTP